MSSNGEISNELAPPPPPPQSPGSTSANGAVWPLFLGFFFFGLTLGVTTGLSSVSGISQVLLSSLFTFVGGVLLTYAGFRRGDGEASLDPARVGFGLTAFALGILLGLYAGIYARLDPPVPAALKSRLVESVGSVEPEGVGSASGSGERATPRFELNAAAIETCALVRERLLTKKYSSDAACGASISDLAALHEALCPPPAGG